MSYSDKLQEINDTYTQIKDNIQKKYDKVMGEIVKLDEKIRNIENNEKVQNSKQWINEQVTKIQNKISEKKKKLEEWLNKQLEKAQKWVDGVMEIIKEKIAEMIASMLKALAGI
jgi:chromosome segregation ATPase